MKKILLIALMFIGLGSVASAEVPRWNVKNGDPVGGFIYPMLIEDNDPMIHVYYCVLGKTYVIISNSYGKAENFSLTPLINLKDYHLNCKDFEDARDKLYEAFKKQQKGGKK